MRRGCWSVAKRLRADDDALTGQNFKVRAGDGAIASTRVACAPRTTERLDRTRQLQLIRGQSLLAKCRQIGVTSSFCK
jgi:hypothetical protein